MQSVLTKLKLYTHQKEKKNQILCHVITKETSKRQRVQKYHISWELISGMYMQVKIKNIIMKIKRSNVKKITE